MEALERAVQIEAEGILAGVYHAWMQQAQRQRGLLAGAIQGMQSRCAALLRCLQRCFMSRAHIHRQLHVEVGMDWHLLQCETVSCLQV